MSKQVNNSWGSKKHYAFNTTAIFLHVKFQIFTTSIKFLRNGRNRRFIEHMDSKQPDLETLTVSVSQNLDSKEKIKQITLNIFFSLFLINMLTFVVNVCKRL